MRGIKHTLTERWYVWEAARKLAETDPEVNLAAGVDEDAYVPQYEVRLCCYLRSLHNTNVLLGAICRSGRGSRRVIDRQC